MNRTAYTSALIVLLGSASACATAAGSLEPGTARSDIRTAVIARAQLWTPTDVPMMDLKLGPQGKGAVPFRATVDCDFVNKKLDGNSPIFACLIC